MQYSGLNEDEQGNLSLFTHAGFRALE